VILIPFGIVKCPRFGQDRVKFHQNPGSGTAGGLTQPQPGQTEPGIPYHVPSCWVRVGGRGGQSGGNSLAARGCGCRSCPGERLSRFVLCFLLICIIVVPVPFVCCSVKLPLSRPTSFLPVSFHSPPHTGGGRGGHVVLLLPAAAKTRTLIWRPRGGGDNGRAEQRVLKLLS